ncbi:MAG: tryptophan 7-halogenase [Alcanivoracaceae bacterium]|nr:tryptophan 7-halogenase [Alcanivoracaceae bacterium]
MKTKYDVVLLGAGHSSTMLATILAGNNVNVLVLDKQEHPKFAIGESTIPRTSMMAKLMSVRYDIPELAQHAFFDAKASTTNGIKRNFGFVYHRAGQLQQPDEVLQALIPESYFGPESHLYRQDTDASMLFSAIRRGADVLQRAEIRAINTHSEGVELELVDGRQVRADYLVDGTGYQSLLAKKHELRVPADTLQTHSRTIFTHMIDVKPYESIEPERLRHDEMPRLWSQGTLHHIFDGGWLWVIPFDNHDKSLNRLCSVGLTFDTRAFPATGTDPEDEFNQFLAQHTDIASQFRDARRVREWTRTERLQFSSHKSIGERWCLMSHSAGFIDALFSRGLANTAMNINLLAERLIAAKRDGDYSTERFRSVEQLQQSLVSYNDRLVNCSFLSWKHYPLWDAWSRIWILGSFLDSLRLQSVYQAHERSGDKGVFERLDERRFAGSLCPGVEAFDHLFNACARCVEQAAAGECDADAAAQQILAMIEESNLAPPALALTAQPRRNDPVMGRQDMLTLASWIRRQAPDDIAAWYSH